MVNGPPLHRAFSVFLFSQDGQRLLLQQVVLSSLFPFVSLLCSDLLEQRANEKITFPAVRLWLVQDFAQSFSSSIQLWTNTVCSHPLKEVSGYGQVDSHDESDGLEGAHLLFIGTRWRLTDTTQRTTNTTQHNTPP